MSYTFDVLAFSIPGSDRLAATRLRRLDILAHVDFQYPRFGSFGCNPDGILDQLLERINFQYPRFGSFGCNC